MEILFKDDYRYYYINEDNMLFCSFSNRDIQVDHIDINLDVDLSNVTHLDDAEVLYHYIDSENGKRYPVYYEHNRLFITVSKISDGYLIYDILNQYIKDYTLVNLNLL